MSVFCPRCENRFAASDNIRFCPDDGTAVLPFGQPSEASPLLQVGEVLLDQFEIEAFVGRGAMGEVYRARQRIVERAVAVKVLRRELIDERDTRRRFHREAEALARLAHPHIVQLLIVAELKDGTPYLVSEFVDGESLEDRLAQTPRPAFAELVTIGMQLASALAYSHAMGVVHRDLKPANILVSGTGVDVRCKIVDFGIAKLLSGRAAQSILTQEGLVCGTPHYISPEQARGLAVDARADVYALGIMLFRLATGRLPFDADSGMQVVMQHLRADVPRVSSNVPAIDRAFDSLVFQCMAKRPEDRPQSAAEVGARLERCGARATTKMNRVTDELLAGAISKPRAAIGSVLLFAIFAVGIFVSRHYVHPLEASKPLAVIAAPAPSAQKTAPPSSKVIVRRANDEIPSRVTTIARTPKVSAPRTRTPVAPPAGPELDDPKTERVVFPAPTPSQGPKPLDPYR